MPIPATQPYPLQMLSVPYSWLVKTGFLLAEGEPCLAGIKASDGTVYSFIVAGGHDLTNKVVSAAGQTCSGEPTIQAPSGCRIYDTLNQYDWISNGWQGGAPANGLDSPIEGMITASNFQGWTAFCPCITGESIASSGYSSNGITDNKGGGSGLIATPCCPDGIQPTVYLSITSPWSGTYQLVWNSNLQYWQLPNGNPASLNCGGTPTAMLLGLRCENGVWQLGILITNNTLPPQFWGANVAVFEPPSTSCSPFDLAQTNGSPVSGPAAWYCGGSSTLSWSVTD